MTRSHGHEPDRDPADPLQDDDENPAPLFLEDWESDVYGMEMDSL